MNNPTIKVENLGQLRAINAARKKQRMQHRSQSTYSVPSSSVHSKPALSRNNSGSPASQANIVIDTNNKMFKSNLYQSASNNMEKSYD